MAILITGSSRGLGSHIGKLFEERGNAVVYHRRKRKVSLKAKNMITADLLNKIELNSELLKIKNLGIGIEHLICNAGQSSYQQDDLSSFENIEKALAENVIVTSNAMHSTLKYHGKTLKTITIIGSICGEEYIVGAPIEYGIAKSTLRALNKASAHYLSTSGIRCNMITPGNLMFEGSVWHRKIHADRLAVEKYLNEMVPGGKIGVPQDIFDAIQFVISDKSNFLNGANIVLDGAQTKKMVDLLEYDMRHHVVLITGAGGLLGEFHCEALLELGARVVATDISDENLKKLRQNKTIKRNLDKVKFIQLDISQEDDIRQTSTELIHQNWSPTTLVNNAAVNPAVSTKGLKELGRLEDFNEQTFLREVSVGLTGAIHCSRIFGAVMAKNNFGNIINIASDLAVIAPNQTLYRDRDGNSEMDGKKPVSYSAIKHAVIGLTKYLATYFCENNVRCNALSPGGVKYHQNIDFIKDLENLIPLGRMADVREYKGAIKFLCSDASRYMNGQNLIVDGGRSIW